MSSMNYKNRQFQKRDKNKHNEIPGLKNTIPEIKSSLDGFNSWMEIIKWTQRSILIVQCEA